jgi:hypothetical protein
MAGMPHIRPVRALYSPVHTLPALAWPVQSFSTLHAVDSVWLAAERVLSGTLIPSTLVQRKPSSVLSVDRHRVFHRHLSGSAEPWNHR